MFQDVYEKKEGQRGLVLIVNFKFSGDRERQGNMLLNSC